MYYVIFSTPAGWIGLLASAKGLCLATLPQPTEQAVYDLMGDSTEKAAASPERFTDLIGRYRAYFSGLRVDFTDKLDLTGATAFQRDVWQTTCGIPYGQTRSYAWVADRAGRPKAVRAAGQALARNPLPVIVPCHRVLASDGTLGGFSGGLSVKKYLLALEANGRVQAR
jgi:methylated-DNA-[protein]-cysteine S-methyltransferase